MAIHNFYIAGINYKKTDAFKRGEFAINEQQYDAILKNAASIGLKELIVVSTCNRTEIYGFADDIDILINLLCSHTCGNIEDFKALAYKKGGLEATEHLFSVAAGLDSQILGDYEIIGQIKSAVKFARERGFVGTILDRMLNFVFQCSKAIKNQTSLSQGTVSVSFSAIQFLKETTKDIHQKKIVLIGTGKIGTNTCKNLVDYLKAKNIVLINRNPEKAQFLASELNLNASSFENMLPELADADIVIVATNADQPIIEKKHVAPGNKILIDLSIPNNIEPAIKELKGIQLVNVDDLSKINDLTLQKRLTEVPKAKKIIEDYQNEFILWLHLRKNVSVLKEVKEKLIDLSQMRQTGNHEIPGLDKNISSADLQKIVNSIALRMRSHNRPGCHYIEAINEFINCESKSI